MRTLLLLAAVAWFVSGCDNGDRTITAPSIDPPVSTPVPASAEPSEPRDLPREPEPTVGLPAQVDGAGKRNLTPPEVKLLAISERRKKTAETLKAFADTIDDVHHIGTIYNEVGVLEGSCFAKGALLGMADLVAHLDDDGSPDLLTRSEDNAHALRVQALTHENFSGVIEAHVGRSRDELVVEWNLDCLGKHGIPETAGLAQTGTSSFYQIKNEGQVLMVLGDIEEGFADKVIAALKANPAVRTVSLGSGGGYVFEAMRAGLYIRDNGYDTVLWNGCYSACPLVFMAGRKRDIWSPYPELGFHQVSNAEGAAVPLDDPIYKTIAQYLIRMDVDPRLVLTNMWSSPPHGMTRVRDLNSLCESNVATWIQRVCNSELQKSH